MTDLRRPCLSLDGEWRFIADPERLRSPGDLPDGEPEQFGAVLAKDSPLTDCVSQAVDTLREDGVLDQIGQEWLAQQGAPELS